MPVGSEVSNAAMYGDAVHPWEVLRDDSHFILHTIAIRVPKHDDITRHAARYVDGTRFCDGHHSRVAKSLRENLNAHPCRYSQAGNDVGRPRWLSWIGEAIGGLTTFQRSGLRPHSGYRQQSEEKK